MASLIQPLRGMKDLYGESMRAHNYVLASAQAISAQYGFSPVSPPLVESSDVFHRTLGDTSDVVSKETYSFNDRGGDSITLRPELTASIVRMFLSNGLHQALPFRASYAGAAFRYERPQKGRQRQFHQVGVEMLGATSPLDDAEIIACGWKLLQTLGITDLVLHINTLGDNASRALYRKALVEYLQAHQHALSEESQQRLERNPLRVLDSKQEEDQLVVANAPKLSAYLSEEATQWWQQVQQALQTLNIPYQMNERLVRGLDYYQHTVFEVITTQLGAQGTVLAGGRYDGLVEQMGGKACPGIGWAAGVERLAALLPLIPDAPQTRIYCIAMEPSLQLQTLAVAESLRSMQKQAIVTLAREKSIGKALKKAADQNARFAVMIGGDEWHKDGLIIIKDLMHNAQHTSAPDQLTAWFEQHCN